MDYNYKVGDIVYHNHLGIVCIKDINAKYDIALVETEIHTRKTLIPIETICCPIPSSSVDFDYLVTSQINKSNAV